MMGNGGLGLELDLRGEIKGEDERDKREVGGKRKENFGHWEDPAKTKKRKKPERRKKKKKRENKP